ncbi:MAG: glutathione S-transferase family protein [Phenylobacterium sp.]|uniref:glutathione S-transferase family protein n=1 Tax=Phenylobacterium sp. TaxID=1871053 RepID=UPI003918D1D6
MELVIGTRKWSSWSMRPWLVLKHVGADFTETLVELREEGVTQPAIAAHSPSGLVPALKTDGIVIWDSLAICEFLAERFPQARLWPQDPHARALARAAACEMHSGFQSLRGECPLALDVAPHRPSLSPATEANVRRIVRLWSDLLNRFGGPFLGGPDWGVADAFYTPVASRFHTYGVRLSDYGDLGAAGAYCERLLETPEFQAWAAGA